MKKYRSNVSSPKVMKLLFIGSLFLLGAVIYSQVESSSFPVYTELLAVLLFPGGIYTFLWVISILMPITVKPENIKCYNAEGRYKELNWSQIERVSILMVYGLPYANVESNTLTSPITIPLYLKNMKDFKETIYKYAGENNPLSQFLKNET